MLASGARTPNGVQHVVQPLDHLEAWPDQDRRSRAVFITGGIRSEELLALPWRLSGQSSGRDRACLKRTHQCKAAKLDPKLFSENSWVSYVWQRPMRSSCKRFLKAKKGPA